MRTAQNQLSRKISWKASYIG